MVLSVPPSTRSMVSASMTASEFVACRVTLIFTLDEMDKIEIYRGFEIREFEREQGRWRAEIRKVDGSTLKILVGDSGHRMSITTSADTLTAETSIDEVKKAIDAGGLS